jgi:hypothetical protein
MLYFYLFKINIQAISRISMSNPLQTLAFRYGWWEDNEHHNHINHDHSGILKRIHEGCIAETATVEDGRFRSAYKHHANHSTCESVDKATNFHNIHNTSLSQIDALRSHVEVLDGKIKEAKRLHRALLAYQIEHCARTDNKPLIDMTLAEAVQTKYASSLNM